MSELTFEQYRKFVDNITSNESKQYSSFLHRLAELEMSDGHINQNVNIPRLLTASLGMMSEGGEFGDIVKKILFQGKEIDEDTKKHLKSELSDICWYMVQAIKALDTSWEEIFDINIVKLSERYPGGFDALKSASRKVGDI